MGDFERKTRIQTPFLNTSRPVSQISSRVTLSDLSNWLTNSLPSTDPSRADFNATQNEKHKRSRFDDNKRVNSEKLFPINHNEISYKTQPDDESDNDSSVYGAPKSNRQHNNHQFLNAPYAFNQRLLSHHDQIPPQRHSQPQQNHHIYHTHQSTNNDRPMMVSMRPVNMMHLLTYQNSYVPQLPPVIPAQCFHYSPLFTKVQMPQLIFNQQPSFVASQQHLAPPTSTLLPIVLRTTAPPTTSLSLHGVTPYHTPPVLVSTKRTATTLALQPPPVSLLAITPQPPHTPFTAFVQSEKVRPVTRKMVFTPAPRAGSRLKVVIPADEVRSNRFR